MNILFIDHECHQKTRSAEFFLVILRRTNNVRIVYYKKVYKVNIPEEDRNWADVVVIWEFLLSRYTLGCIGKPCVFVPMYDNEWESFWQWKRIAWSGMGVISFCDKITSHARHCGVTNIIDVRYFPTPSEFPQREGDPKRVFLWERGEIGRDVVERLFPSSEGYVFDVKRSGEFMERKAYLERLAKCGIVIAPRRKEGIGMAFLEAMAMGKCVVANNDATMNEYIRDGDNGILFSVAAPKPILGVDVEKVIQNVTGSAVQFHTAWRSDSEKIDDFISCQRNMSMSWMDRQKISWAYPLFLLEGSFRFLQERAFKK